jgi:hypothetical protein
MAANSATLEAPRGVDEYVGEDYEVLSYKCEECGKIIAVPSVNPIPTCCDDRMRNISWHSAD